jgi:hypothetical protein
MKYILSLIIGGALVVSGFGQTRNVLVGTNNAVVQPTNFWSADASNARTGLGLGSAATSPASAFQPASTNLTLLASNDGSSLTNLNISGLGTISISNISGLQSVLDGKLATNGSAANLTSFPSTILQTTSAITNFPAGLLRANGDGSGLTNLPIPATASNVLSTIAVAKGGTGATNAPDARINLGATTVGNAVFIATNAASARSALSLGTASTSSVADFQPSSSILTNLAANNGGGLTNITAANITGTVGLASNITGTAALATNVTGVVALANGGTGGTNAATARSGIGVGTTNTLTIAGLVSQNLTISAGGGITLQSAITNDASFRTNIGLPWVGLTNTTASGFRTALELGTAATNPSTAFQPSSSALTNLAENNGISLTNLQASNLVGIIASSNIQAVNLTNISGVLAVSKGGTSATNASDARTSLGITTVGNSLFTATNTSAARTAIGALASNDNGSGLTNLTAANITGSVAIINGGTGATNTTTARTNLGLGWSALTNTDATNFRNDIGLGATWLTNTNVTNFRTAIGLGVTNVAFFDGLQVLGSGIEASGILLSGTNATLVFDEESAKAKTRTNLGFPWSGLTNTNSSTFQAALFGSNTNPVLVNTNGEVVSPTNFWAAAPISTTVQYQTNITGTSTNAATNSRNLFLFSLSPSVSGITNTVTLPTNPATTFEGDRATITHLAQTTNTVTAIRQLGAVTNLITLNQLDETVLLMYRSGAWRLADNISYIEPIYFSGTNASANAAASRTNLGLGATNDVVFRGIEIGGTNPTFYVPSDGTLFEVYKPIWFGDRNGTNNIFEFEAEDEDIARTNLGLPLPALTNTNNANFRNAIELGATNNVSFSNVTASGTLTATGTVTATTNLVVNGFVDFSTNHTNSNPATNNQINDFIEIRVGTNQFWLPVYK